MKHISRLFLLVAALFLVFGADAQVNKWQDVYKAKKKDTLFGISRKYGITLPELI